MRNALLLFKRPVGWLVGGAKWGGMRAWGKNFKPADSQENLFDNGTWNLGANWTDNGDGSYTVTAAGSITWLSNTVNAELVQGETYEARYTISGYSAGNARMLVRGTVGSVNSANGDVVDSAIIAGSGNTTGIQAASGSTFTVSNLQLYHVPPQLL